ncbi:MAG: rRNA maturation RNase YbeY [Phycisphaerales bacterium]|nr:rRNA maturation RNase YbeY [Phycisphaerales bacterium]
MSHPTRDCDDRDEPGSSAEGDGPPEPADRPAPSPAETNVASDCLASERAAVLMSRVATIAAMLARDVARIGIRVVRDAEMQSLHRRWHNRDATTDVITFEAHPEGPLEVDMVLCLDEAERAAASRSHSADEELLLYAVHGLLHCCGFDDHTASEAAAMHEEEDRLLQEIGLPAVYRVKGGAS